MAVARLRRRDASISADAAAVEDARTISARRAFHFGTSAMTLSAKPAPGVVVPAFGRRIAAVPIARTLAKADTTALAGLVSPDAVRAALFEPDRLAVWAALAAASSA